jgi:hypothetical protein
MVPLSDVPPSQVTVEVAPLSDLDKEIERYIEQILTDVAMEEPFVWVSPEVEVVGKPLEPEHGGTTEVEALIVKGVLVAAVGREEARPVFTVDDEPRLGREGLIAGQVATDTPSVATDTWDQ